MMIFKATTLAVAILGSTLCAFGDQPQGAVNVKRCFVDDANKDAEFNNFRSDLIDAVSRRNANDLRRFVADDIDVSVSGAKGRADFDRVYTPDKDTALIWEALENVLKQGGVFVDPGNFCAPFWGCTVSGDTNTVIILGDRVPAYAAPVAEPPVLQWLSCDVLQVAGDKLPETPNDYPSGWMPVFLRSRWAFVEAKFVADTAGWYAMFARRNGEWKLTAFLAGD